MAEPAHELWARCVLERGDSGADPGRREGGLAQRREFLRVSADDLSALAAERDEGTSRIALAYLWALKR
jgi:hypothetical protein